MDGLDIGDLASVESPSLQETPAVPDWMTMFLSFAGFALIGTFMVGIARPVVGVTFESGTGNKLSNRRDEIARERLEED